MRNRSGQSALVYFGLGDSSILKSVHILRDELFGRGALLESVEDLSQAFD
jgi:hypothetical protein